MKETIKKSLVGGIVFCLPILTLFIAYAATTYYTDLPQVSSGSVLSSSSWNNMVNYVNKAVKQDSEVLTITGGNVGIGTTSPSVKLDVNGNAKANQFLFSTDTGNSNYVRIGNTQICWGTTETATLNTVWSTYTNYHNYNTVTFPVAFKNGTTPVVTTSCSNYNVCSSGAGGITYTSFYPGAFAVNNNTVTSSVTWMAIGVWQ